MKPGGARDSHIASAVDRRCGSGHHDKNKHTGAECEYCTRLLLRESDGHLEASAPTLAGAEARGRPMTRINKSINENNSARGRILAQSSSVCSRATELLLPEHTHVQMPSRMLSQLSVFRKNRHSCTQIHINWQLSASAVPRFDIHNRPD